ncbi:MAG TPA: cellulase family glycosylhydrolase [Actinomycetota bacterium]|nr:cellulase family glycosylhydrolase [Actinomycetota bacterium]
MRGSLVTACAVLLCIALAVPAAEANHVDNALHRKVISEIEGFRDWLNRHDAPGFVGETGWPDDYNGEADQWNDLAEDWFDVADAAGLGAVVWATGDWWGDYKLAVYENRDDEGGVESANTQAPVLEAHSSTSSYSRGINVSTGTFCEGHGLERTSTFSNHDTGKYNTCYKYDSQETFDYIAARGIDLVKIEFRWEILQRRLGGPLHQKSVDRLVDVVSRAEQAGLKVIISMHNFGAYWLWDGEKGVRRAIGSRRVPVGRFTDVWTKLSDLFIDHPAVSYAIMSEPVGLKKKGDKSPAEVWEWAAQAALTAIRANGDNHLILVNGYRWSSLADWPKIHPQPFIEDPANNFVYTAHHYWDRDWSGSYDYSYSDEVQYAESKE